MAGAMADAVLIITAKRRPEYFEQVLESWARARGVHDLYWITIRLARSDPNMEYDMSALARSVAREYQLPLRVVLDDPEDGRMKGQDLALGKEITASFSDPACQFVMQCDDDIIVSDDVLEYFTWARELGVDCVCAHNDLGQGWSPQWDDAGAAQDLVRVRGEFTSWCWGVPREAWERVWGPTWDWSRTSGSDPMEHGWEWEMHRQANKGLRVAIPDASRCQNIGEHGGDFSLPWMFTGTQAKSFRASRKLAEYRLGEDTASTKIENASSIEK